MPTLCKPASTILLIGIAGVIYNLLINRPHASGSWALVAVFGAGLFQGLCFGGFEPVAWIVLLFPVLILCFFLAVALFANSMRIETDTPCLNPRDECEEGEHVD